MSQIILSFSSELSATFNTPLRRYLAEHALHPIPLHKTEAISLRTTGIDESTVQGQAQIHANLFTGQLGVYNMGSRIALVFGDQLTYERMVSMLHYARRQPGTLFEQCRHVYPVLAFWHLRWHVSKVTLSIHTNLTV